MLHFAPFCLGFSSFFAIVTFMVYSQELSIEIIKGKKMQLKICITETMAKAKDL